eukprot:Pgem_evm1s12993
MNFSTRVNIYNTLLLVGVCTLLLMVPALPLPEGAEAEIKGNHTLTPPVEVSIPKPPLRELPTKQRVRRCSFFDFECHVNSVVDTVVEIVTPIGELTEKAAEGLAGLVAGIGET